MPDEWYYEVMGEVFGPLSSDELRALARDKKIASDTIVRKGERRVLAYTINGLFNEESAGHGVINSNPSNEPTIQLKRCPFCAEVIKLEAIKCKHCGSDLRQSILPKQNVNLVQNVHLVQNVDALSDSLADDSRIFMKAFFYWFFGSIVTGLVLGLLLNEETSFVMAVFVCFPFYVWMCIYAIRVALKVLDIGIVILLGIGLVIPLINFISLGIIASIAHSKLKRS